LATRSEEPRERNRKKEGTESEKYLFTESRQRPIEPTIASPEGNYQTGNTPIFDFALVFYRCGRVIYVTGKRGLDSKGCNGRKTGHGRGIKVMSQLVNKRLLSGGSHKKP
jgi:hypothetical protein